MDDNGILNNVDIKIFCDCGYTTNEATANDAATFAQNCYASKAWNIEPSAVKTDTAANTFCRAPGTTQVIKVVAYIALLGKLSW